MAQQCDRLGQTARLIELEIDVFVAARPSAQVRRGVARLVGGKGDWMCHIAQRVVFAAWQRLFDKNDAPLGERLGEWLRECQLERCAEGAPQWARDSGISDIEEVWPHLEELAVQLVLTPIERARLL